MEDAEEMRRGSKRDSNEQEIVKTLEELGFAVERINSEGMPDLLLSKARRWYVVEVKSATGPLTQLQKEMHARAKADIPVLRSREEAILWGTLVR